MHNDTTKLWNQGRVIGEVKDGALCKSILGSRHILRKPPAIALSAESLKQAKAAGATRIKIRDRETGALYVTDMTHFDRYSFEIQRGGFELQRAMCIERFDVIYTMPQTGGASHVTPAPKHESTDTPAPEYHKPSEVQLSFFAEG